MAGRFEQRKEIGVFSLCPNLTNESESPQNDSLRLNAAKPRQSVYTESQCFIYELQDDGRNTEMLHFPSTNSKAAEYVQRASL